MTEIQQPDLELKEYIIIFTLLLGDNVQQQQLKVYFTDTEAYEAYKTLNNKITLLVRNNSSISMSFICRNEVGDRVSYGLTGIVGITHNIPPFEDVIEE